MRPCFAVLAIVAMCVSMATAMNHRMIEAKLAELKEEIEIIADELKYGDDERVHSKHHKSMNTAEVGYKDATVKMGGDNGELQFVPSSVTIKAGESVIWVNNQGFPHNIVFDEDQVPDGVNADALSHEDYFNGPGERWSMKFDRPGTYVYFCEPHQGAGMVARIIVH